MYNGFDASRHFRTEMSASDFGVIGSKFKVIVA